MAQTFCTGPVHVGVGIESKHAAGSIGAVSGYYYGTTRQGPDIKEEKSYFDIMNDLAGPKLPLDRGYAGTEHTITLEFTRWDGATDLMFDKSPTPTPLGAATGSENANERGRTVSGLQAIHLLLVLSNGGTAAPPAATMLRWRRYPQVVPIGPDAPIWGNKENIRTRIFRAQNVFKGVDLSNLDKEMFRLFDESTGALPFTFTVT